MRILHIGNIANNSYNNAKFLRRLGVEADALTYDAAHVMGDPEWEDADFDDPVAEFWPDWSAVDLKGWRRPSWFRTVKIDPVPRRMKQRFRGQLRMYYWARTLRRSVSAFRIGHDLRHDYHRHNAPVGRRRRLLDILQYVQYEKAFQRLFAGYDLIQAYALDPIPVLLFGSQPFVAFEHGTMRDIPFEDSTRGRLLRVAYHRARKVIITNPDVVQAARRLGLTRYVFIPHPVDEEKFCPGGSSLRAEIQGQLQCEHVLFAPARHNWRLKGNERILRAMSKLLADGFDAGLVLCRWGQELEATDRLIDELELRSRVLWVPPLNKLKLVDYYNAADVVLDQFVIGTFGTVTPEAMACAKPVIIHFDPAVHAWCYQEMPPVARARTSEEILERLRELLGDPPACRELGLRSRAWIERHHGSRLVAERQLALYREILAR